MRENKLRATLKAGGLALGTIVWEVKGRGVFHTLAQAGMDFVFICCEHSGFGLETAVAMVAEAHAAGITPVVRIPDLQYEHVTRLLDTGCQSLIAPHFKTGDEARRFIDLAKYHPAGHRGMAIGQNAGVNYEDVEPVAAMRHANANTLLAVLIETREAVANAEAILLPGIDLVLVGHQDLSQNLGVPGEYGHALVREANAKVVALCRERGIATAGAINRPEDTERVVASGAQFLLYGTDLGLMRREAERAAKALAPLRNRSRT